MRLDIQTGWLKEVAHCPSPFFDQRPHRDDISLVVIHNISMPQGVFGTPYIQQLFTGKLDKTAYPTFAAIDAKVSAHVVIDREGKLVQYVSFYDRAWHAGVSSYEGRTACNDFSIGIELEGSDETPFELVQYTCLQELLLLLFQHFPVLTAQRLTGHEHIAPGRKTDPGPFFDWDYLLTLLS